VRRKWVATIALTAIICVTVAGCGGGSDEGLTLRLIEQNGSGQSGTATFTLLPGDRTRIVMELGRPPDVSQPAHVHSGSCDDLGRPVVALKSLENGRSVTEVEVPLEDLERDGLVVHAHKSDDEYDISVACAPMARG
jgi:hypothetical protein